MQRSHVLRGRQRLLIPGICQHSHAHTHSLWQTRRQAYIIKCSENVLLYAQRQLLQLVPLVPLVSFIFSRTTSPHCDHFNFSELFSYMVVWPMNKTTICSPFATRNSFRSLFQNACYLRRRFPSIFSFLFRSLEVPGPGAQEYS